MNTKTFIVQRLLDQKQITAEEAVTLLTPTYQYVPYWPQQVPYYFTSDYSHVNAAAGNTPTTVITTT